MLEPKYRAILEAALRDAGIDPSYRAPFIPTKKYAEPVIVVAEPEPERCVVTDGRRRGGRANPVSEDDLRRTADLYREHGSSVAVAKILDMHPTNVLARLRKAGVKVGKPGRRKVAKQGMTVMRCGAYERPVWSPGDIMAAAE
ncbi:hypothetical protein [Azospirillum himalayense]|uniref:Helix-turn-helix domain-containing protein n=1 Tax=Azospirillum himalayense TaxID=654847 RepID=A0ABW0FZU2_9PROT